MLTDDEIHEIANRFPTLPNSVQVTQFAHAVLAATTQTPPCTGTNCDCTDGRSHSAECYAEHAETITGDRAASAPAAPQGWKLVPIEPTNAMLDAYISTIGRFPSARSDWRAMLAAAPAAPAQSLQSTALTCATAATYGQWWLANRAGFAGPQDYFDAGMAYARAVDAAKLQPEETPEKKRKRMLRQEYAQYVKGCAKLGLNVWTFEQYCNFVAGV